jgi:hypothetical protein
VYVGVSSEQDEDDNCINSSYFNESVVVKFDFPVESKTLSQTWRTEMTIERKVTQSTTKGILDVMFEKLPPSKDKVRITVDFGGKRSGRLFHI